MTVSTALRPASSFRRSASLVALGQAALKSSQVIITIVLVRLVNPAEWARCAYLLSIYLAAVTFGTVNLQHGIVFFGPRVGFDRLRALVRQTALVLAAIGAVIAAGLVLARPVLSGGRLDVGSALPLLALAVLLELPTACAPAALIAQDRLGRAAAWDIAAAGFQITAVVGAVVARPTAASAALGLLASAVARFAMFVGVTRDLPGAARGLPAGTLRRQLTYGLPLGLALATSVLNRSVDKWIVAAFDTGNIGVYAVAAQEIPLLAVVPYAGGTAVVTRMVEAFRSGDRQSALTLWVDQTASMARFVVPVTLAVVLVAPQLFVVVFTDDFRAGVLPFQLFTAITLHRVAEYGLVLRAADRTRDLLLSSVVLLAANAVLAGLGAWRMGMAGAALGTLVANAIAWIFVLSRVASAFATTIPQVFAWRAWLTVLLVGSCAAVAARIAVGLSGLDGLGAALAELVVFGGLLASVALRMGRSTAKPPALSLVASPVEASR